MRHQPLFEVSSHGGIARQPVQTIVAFGDQRDMTPALALKCVPHEQHAPFAAVRGHEHGGVAPGKIHGRVLIKRFGDILGLTEPPRYVIASFQRLVIEEQNFRRELRVLLRNVDT